MYCEQTQVGGFRTTAGKNSWGGSDLHAVGTGISIFLRRGRGIPQTKERLLFILREWPVTGFWRRLILHLQTVMACHPHSRYMALGWQDKVQPLGWEPGCVSSVLKASAGVIEGGAWGPWYEKGFVKGRAYLGLKPKQNKTKQKRGELDNQLQQWTRFGEFRRALRSREVCDLVLFWEHGGFERGLMVEEGKTSCPLRLGEGISLPTHYFCVRRSSHLEGK